MAESARTSGLAERLRRLPGQLLLALVNATALLVIIAAVLAIVALNRVNHAAAALAGNVARAVVAEIHLEPDALMDGLRELDSEIRELRAAFAEGRAERSAQIEEKIEALTQAVAKLDATLTGASGRITDQAIRQLGESATDGLLRLRRCKADATANDEQPIGSLGPLVGGRGERPDRLSRS